MSKIQIAKAKRLRSTPYTSRIEKQGLKAYTTYNHMLLPAAFEGSLEETYYHLKKYVQIWDVAAERQVEISGNDAAELVQLMTCRDLSKSKDLRCYYCPIIDDQARLINDPVVLRINENKWWLSIADSDVILFAKGLAIGKNYKVIITEPDVNIMAVQGPKSFTLMEKVFGKSITDLKFFGFDYFDFKGTKHLIARSGWSKQGGYEVYVEHTKSGLELYDHLFEIGKEFNVKPGCPHLIERIESALLSYGNDFDLNDNPLECGFDKYVNLDNDIEFLGKQKLIDIKKSGVSKKLMGVKIDLDKINLSQAIDITIDSKRVGEVRSAVYSPTFNKVIAIAMVDKPYFVEDTPINVVIDNVPKTGILCNIPFV
ncbi:dimethylsulfoniopropionate demethylase [Pelagibacterales bacterium SAG-MED31]|nr:dimethylsulfoniopropionate demethylase [Pelagibacterales bacterium SAG-MED31]